MCDPGAIHWIEVVFDDCIITPRDKGSFAVGLISNVVFLVSSIPQIVLNCRSKRVDGQSPFFFSLLFLASALNLIGVIITKGLITQILTGAFYVLMDAILFFQFIAYRYCVRKDKHEEEEELSEASKGDDMDVDGVPAGALAVTVLAAQASAATDFKDPYTGGKLVGTVFGWVAGAIFISSRIPQIAKNCRLRSVGDLSPVYIAFSIAGNLTYFVSVLMRQVTGTYLWRQAPFIVGAVGPMLCDGILAVQMCAFRQKKGERLKNEYDDQNEALEEALQEPDHKEAEGAKIDEY